MNKVIALLFFLSMSCNAYAQEFIREHTYRASDDDSKNDSRSAALKQMQIGLLSEIGVYIESEMLMKFMRRLKRDESRENNKDIQIV